MLLRIVPLLLAAAAIANAQDSRTADQLLTQAKTEAASSNRAVWLIFHASW